MWLGQTISANGTIGGSIVSVGLIYNSVGPNLCNISEKDPVSQRLGQSLGVHHPRKSLEHSGGPVLLSKSASLWLLAGLRCSLLPGWAWLSLYTRALLAGNEECWFLLIWAKWCVCKERLSGLVSVIWTTIDGFSVLSPSFSSNLLLNIRQERCVRDLFLCCG